MRTLLAVLVAATATGFALPPPKTDRDPLGALREHASDMLPDGGGERRRTVVPFGGWTLVCDHDVASAKRRCNLSPQLVDARGRPAFSWTLVGERNRDPVLLLRGAGDGPRSVHIAIGRLASVSAALDICGPAACIGVLPVGHALATALTTDRRAEITAMTNGRLSTMVAPLAGIAEALASLR